MLRIGLVLLATIVLGGCSDSDGDQAGATSSTASSPVTTVTTAGPVGSGPGCALVPAALVSEHVGVAVEESAPSDRGGSVVCNYFSPDKNQIVVRFRSPTTAGDFAKEKGGFVNSGSPVMDVPGVGDEAFSASFEFLGRTTNTFAARKGDVDVLISAKVPIDNLRSLTTAILAKF